MARARNIKPSFFKNEDLSELDPYARLLFIGLWCLADREGLLEDRPKRIKGELFPYENVDVDKHLQELHDKGFIIRYQVDGAQYISIPKFVEHQNPHHREAPSKLPKPGIKTEDSINEEQDWQAKPQDSLGLSSESTGKGTAQPDESRADSLIPDSLKLIPDSLIPPPPTTSSEERSQVVVVGDRPLHVFKSALDLYEHYFGFIPNQSILLLLNSYLDEGMKPEAIAFAMREATEGGKPWNYCRSILDRYSKSGVKTLEQAVLDAQTFHQAKEQRGSNINKVVPIRQDKLPASVQRQLEKEKAGVYAAKPQETRTVMDDPELAAMLRDLRERKSSGG